MSHVTVQTNRTALRCARCAVEILLPATLTHGATAAVSREFGARHATCRAESRAAAPTTLVDFVRASVKQYPYGNLVGECTSFSALVDALVECVRAEASR